MNLSGKIAIVTGGSRGIGETIATTLSKYMGLVLLLHIQRMKREQKKL